MPEFAGSRRTSTVTTPPTTPTHPPWRRLSRQDSHRNMPVPPPFPPGIPLPPPPPPPPPFLAEKKAVKPEVAAKIDALKRTPRKRPDWHTMMKEVESGVKLRKTQTNDRSRPILPKGKARGKFVYDSERPNLHNQLLNQIQGGIKLKRVQCNDRSRPNIQGLRTFRRQLTVEETPVVPDGVMSPLGEELDELDDVDKLRDDLQSTKQLLDIELKEKAKQLKENSDLRSKLRDMQKELEEAKKQAEANAQAPPRIVAKSSSFANLGLLRSRSAKSVKIAENAINGKNESTGEVLRSHSNKSVKIVEKVEENSDEEEEEMDEMDFADLDAIEEEMNTLRGQAELARKSADEWQSQYQDANQKLITAQAELEDAEMKINMLERKLRKAGLELPVEVNHTEAQTDPWNPPMPEHQDTEVKRSYSKKEMRKQMSRQDSRRSEGGTTGEDVTDDECDFEDEEGDGLTRKDRRELSMLTSKLRGHKERERACRNERAFLKTQLAKHRMDITEEQKRYKKLEKEVSKMAKLMNEVEEDEDAHLVVEEVEVEEGEESDDEEEEDAEENEETEEEESEEEEEVPDIESEKDDSTDLIDIRISKLTDRVNNYENNITTLKKGNYLLKTTVDKLQEELRNVRDKYSALELELNTVLAELG